MSRIYAQSRFLSIAKTVHLLRLFSSSNSLSNRNGRSLYLISKIPSRHLLRATLIRSFSACSASQDLTMKKCVPCNSKHIRSMTEQNANELLEQVQDWKLLNDDGIMKLQRSWRVKSFTKGLEFFQLVADIAEAEGHHPDLHLFGWNNVKIEIWTHSVDEWWKMFGSSAPNLQKLAVRLLSQTSSSSGCERNWSVFEQIHIKRRNNLEHQRLNDLVYVRYNLNLRNRMHLKNRNYDHLDFTSIENIDFWVLDEEDIPELNLEDLETEIYKEDAVPGVEGSNLNSTSPIQGGLTENDFILAAKIDSLKLEHLLTKKTASHAV